MNKMKISLNWIKDYVDIENENPKEMGEKITRAGVNVEGVKTLNISNLVVGYVEGKESHPDSNHLSVCQVNIGEEVVQIICGAPNVDKGQKVIVAKNGAILPGDFEIKKTTIRGIESNGMICALFELGLEDKETNYHKGIHVLPEYAVIGSNPLSLLGLDDTIYDLDLNPNRNDCLSHLGFAYEVASVLNKNINLPETKTNNINTNDDLKVIVNTDNCTMYQARIVKDVVIGESPDFIKNRLKNAGMRPINNLVDISNYVMLEYGQPLHFFDQAKVKDTIIVRMANDNEETITLDGKNITLSNDDIVIADNNNVIAVAGVMGCANSAIDENTKDIIIESAIFNPYKVRYTSIKLDLRSESSLRFEKGLNYEYTTEALNRACYLLEKYASGKVTDKVISYDKVDKTPKITYITKDKINNVLGMTLTDDDIKDSFNRLGFNYILKDNGYEVIIPNRRMDVNIKEDLIEEVGRLYGYDNILPKTPTGYIKKGSYTSKGHLNKQISKRMRSYGLNEVRSYTLISEEDNNKFKFDQKTSISIKDPLASDKSIVRQTLIPSLLKIYDYNNARNVDNINIYEISNTYYKKDNEYVEETKLGFLMSGNYIYNNWQNNKVKVDFYLVKGIIENLLDYLGFNNRYTIEKWLLDDMHPGVSAGILIDHEIVGYFGLIHPSISSDIIFVGELSLDKLLSKKVSNLKYRDIPKFPVITKDLAFILDKKIDSNHVIEVIRKTGGKTLTNIDIFDVYQGVNVDEDKKSIAFSLTFMDINKTLTDNEVNVIFNNIIKEVETKLNGILRNK